MKKVTFKLMCQIMSNVVSFLCLLPKSQVTNQIPAVLSPEPSIYGQRLSDDNLIALYNLFLLTCNQIEVQKMKGRKSTIYKPETILLLK